MYQALVCRAKTQPHPNADRLQLVDCFGELVIVGLEVKDGDLGVYFPVDGRLSIEFAEQNDLIRRKDPTTGAQAGGFFDPNRKVRAQNFRGVISNGFWCPISYFDYLVPRDFWEDKRDGFAFDTIEGTHVCQKYITEATLKAQSQGQGKKYRVRAETITFPMHFETKQLAYFVNSIKEGSYVNITSKAHGTSGRVGYTLDEVELPWWKRLVNRIYPVFPTQEYKYMHGSRRVILNRAEPEHCAFHSDSFRQQVLGEFEGKLHKGEIVYFEVVGYEHGGKSIMPPADTTKLQDKEFTSRYGKTMYYDYGCAPGQWKILIYRVANVNPDGVLIDLPWEDVKRRAVQLGMEHVVELHPTYKYDGNEHHLMDLVKVLANQQDPLGAHWQEGVCLRVENGFDLKVYKYKNEIFKFLESITKDDPTVVDIEEAS